MKLANDHSKCSQQHTIKRQPAVVVAENSHPASRRLKMLCALASPEGVRPHPNKKELACNCNVTTTAKLTIRSPVQCRLLSPRLLADHGSEAEWRGTSLDCSGSATDRKPASPAGKWENEYTIQSVPTNQLKGHSKTQSSNIQLLKNTKKFLEKVSILRAGKPKSGTNVTTLKTVCSCSHLPPDQSQSELENSKREPGTKTFRKIFTPQGECTAPELSASRCGKKSNPQSASKKRKGENSGCDRLHEKLKRLTDTCSSVTTASNSGKQQDTRADKENSDRRFQALKARVKTTLDTYKKREELLVRKNRELKAENVLLKKRLVQIQQI